MSEYEVRTFPAAELRLVQSDEGRVRIEGRAIVYDALSEDLGGFREKFVPGSVRLDPDLLALFDHDTSMVLGRVSAGTLEVEDGPHGVDMRAWPPDTIWAKDMRISMERGDIRHMSFRFWAKNEGWDVVGDELIRTVLEAEVSELSVVSMPAYTQTSAQVRARVAQLRDAASPLDSTTDAEQPGGSPDEPAAAGGSPGHTFIAGGRILVLTDTPKGE